MMPNIIDTRRNETAQVVTGPENLQPGTEAIHLSLWERHHGGQEMRERQGEERLTRQIDTIRKLLRQIPFREHRCHECYDMKFVGGLRKEKNQGRNLRYFDLLHQKLYPLFSRQNWIKKNKPLQHKSDTSILSQR
ncbi:hypothetical protein ElyMa_001722100 [Elysia marginata]|uniref:Uncharacterized protein n=1 Tax=Elysia marginata TaxID=1093978 RepID=A0AAV4JW96_9GAST|nr:hypothetical protein ElyMa_001722100 [Elysia marginata]